MILIWRGWGILIPALGAAMLVAGADNPWGFLIAGPIVAAAAWFVGRKVNNHPGRLLVDANTGEEFLQRPVNTFFFVKMEYWAVVLIILSGFWTYIELARV